MRARPTRATGRRRPTPACSTACASSTESGRESQTNGRNVPIRSTRLSAREFDDLGPFLGFLRHEGREPDRRTRKRLATKIRKPPLNYGIGERRVDLQIELAHDFARR